MDSNSMQAPPGTTIQLDTIDRSQYPPEQNMDELYGVRLDRTMPGRLRGLLMRIRPFSLYRQIAIGVALILALGALVGTLITRYLVLHSVHIGWVLLITAAGVTASIIVAWWVARLALRPLYDLQILVRQAKHAQTGIDVRQLASHDPQIQGLAQDVNAMIDELRQRNQQMRALSKHAINAQEDERKRIARSLHDETGQSLTMLIISLEQLEKQIDTLDETAQAQFASAHQLASQALGSLRHIVHGLRPTILDDLGLVPAIRWYAHTNLEAAGIRLKFEAVEEPLLLPARLSTTLFRITQEAVNNIVRHSEASAATIRLACRNEEVQLSIKDDGKGFLLDPDSGEILQEGHWGLAGIRERVSLVNGQVDIQSEQGSGTLIRVIVPIDREDQAQDG